MSIATGKCTYESTDGPGDRRRASKRVVSGLRSLAGFMSHFDAISAMHAHAHLGGVGFFTLLIVGVSYKLIPMFTLSEVQSQRRAGLSVALLNIGLAGSFVTILLRSPWKLAFALVIDRRAGDLRLGTPRHPARPQTRPARLGHPLLPDGGGAC